MCVCALISPWAYSAQPVCLLQSQTDVCTQASLCCHTGINQVWGCVNHCKPQKTHTHTNTLLPRVPCSYVSIALKGAAELRKQETEVYIEKQKCPRRTKIDHISCIFTFWLQLLWLWLSSGLKCSTPALSRCWYLREAYKCYYLVFILQQP